MYKYIHATFEKIILLWDDAVVVVFNGHPSYTSSKLQRTSIFYHFPNNNNIVGNAETSVHVDINDLLARNCASKRVGTDVSRVSDHRS